MKNNKYIAKSNCYIVRFLLNIPAVLIFLTPILSITAISFMAFGGASTPAIPPISLANDPLYAAVTVDKPTLALALSVEFPTVGAQYTASSSIDNTYNNANEYLGYYDAESCYNYNNNPTETISTGLSVGDYKRFDRSGIAISRKCSNAFSGNFLNWASNSAIDMLRLALSGGDRYIDAPSLTILQRAIIPNGDPICMWNSGNFPAKQLSKNGGGTGTYWGAVPTSMINQANGNDIWVANTLNRIYFGTSKAGSCSNTDAYILGKSGTVGSFNSDGFFYARVQVCNTSEGTLQDIRDYGLCRQYPNGNYKPTGVIQKYSDQMRLAAFGYLLEQTASYNSGRYGGVLRAPMKYVGQKTFDINGQDNTPIGGNLNAEWDFNTGIFYTNPDGDITQTPNISGIINYLNKFGRTGPKQGVYKKYDPVGELHYETLRYLQGMNPSADAISGTITPTMQDGFPFFKAWDDPYGGGRPNTSDYSCLKSNIVVIGDTNTHDGNRLPTANTANNIPDINYWRGIVKKFEANTSGTYTDGQGLSRNTGNPNTVNGSSPTSSQTSQIIGSSYWAHTHDIRGTDWSNTVKRRPGLRVKTFIFDVDENGSWFKNPSGRRTINQFFIATKYGGFETDPSNPGSGPYNTYGNPFKNQTGINDNNVWQKSEDPGEAANYFLQSSARGVLSAFDDIFSRATTAARSVAGGASSSRQLSTTVGSIIYSAKFDTSNWSGDVVAEPVSINASNNLVVGNPQWSASDRLTSRPSPAINRKIVMGAGGATANPVAKEFTWASIGTDLQAHLNKASPSATADSLGKDRLNYLRGDRSKEGNPFRVRSSLLGDIVNSSVVYSGAPSPAYTGTGYAAFRSAYDTRIPAVFAGANDGMLHAFNATNGDEFFGYIPSWMAPKISALSDVSFTNNHQNYVDAPPVVAEAQVASAGSATDWKTVLVSGTGSGGSGVFALDVSNPSTFDASNVMWEFTRADDEDMGQVVGQPKILKFKISDTTSPAIYRWFAVVGSGVNNYIPDNTEIFSTTGKPALFLLALDKAVGQSWVLGTNYFKISVPVDATLSATYPTGLANFTPLYGISGEVTEIYMGDFHGKMWKLQFRAAVYPYKLVSPSDWDMAHLSFYNKGTSTSPDAYPLYISQDSGGKPQPITAAPALFTGPVVKGIESFYVVFGTGKYLESADNSSTAINSIYTIYDNGSTKADKSSPTAAVSGRRRLNAGLLNTTTKVISIAKFNWGRAASDADTTQRSGWYFDMPTTGEKLVSNISDLGTLTAAFNSIIPGTPGSTSGSCSNAPGSGNQYITKISDGSGKYLPSPGVGLPGPAMFFSNYNETQITPSDSTGRRIRITTKRGLISGQSGISSSAPVEPIKETIGRLSWRQINNYQDMKNTITP